MRKKVKSTFDILVEQYKKDFDRCSPKTQLEFETQLVYAIQHCNRSLEEQRTEAIAKIELERQNNKIPLFSLLLSFAAIGISIVLNMPTTEVEKTISILISIFLITILYITLIGAMIYQNKRCEVCAYYAVKLECIENLQKEIEKRKENPMKTYNVKVLK